ncbi:uncharacterized protein LOC110293629 [Mus caroli]|uniref:Uncharacterized protein LOC110293629 n=1 Tax=Mus caroli TaxID=10089 RepID=A0A6P5PM28_MUSCR|nr:uncharacterized protein LOC110293629 [Mus caroli]
MEAQPPGLGSGREALGQGSPNPVLLSSSPVRALTCPSTLGGDPGVHGDVTRTRARAHGQRGKEPRRRAGTASSRRLGSPRRGPPGCHFVARPPFRAARGRGRGSGRGPAMGVAGGGRGPGPLCSPPGGREAPRARLPARLCRRRSSV